MKQSINLQNILHNIKKEIRRSRREVITLLVVLVLGIVGCFFPGDVLDGPDQTGAPAANTQTALSSDTVISVNVTGAVLHPGTVRVATGSTVGEALKAAGGAAGNADLSKIDQTKQLSTGSTVSIPAKP